MDTEDTAGAADDPDFRHDCDLIIATSLCDIITLNALCPALQKTPAWLYFHENQFAHPISEEQAASHQISWQFQSVQNALYADWVSFNTAFNRNTFLEGTHQLLKKFPEKLPGYPIHQLTENSDILPVPLMDRLPRMPAGRLLLRRIGNRPRH